MKTKGRAKSKNIEDRRSPFGSEAVPKMKWKSKVVIHMVDSFKAARDYKGAKDYNRFKK